MLKEPDTPIKISHVKSINPPDNNGKGGTGKQIISGTEGACASLQHNVNPRYYQRITDPPNYSSGYSEQAKNFVSN